MRAKAVGKPKGKDSSERYHRMPTRTEAEKLAGMINVLGRKSLEAFRRATIRDALLAITARANRRSR